MAWGEAGLRARSGTTDPDRDLHALRDREGMGKPAYPPQGVGTPVLFEAVRAKERHFKKFSFNAGLEGVLQSGLEGLLHIVPFTRHGRR
jgi:hypothetical protein